MDLPRQYNLLLMRERWIALDTYGMSSGFRVVGFYNPKDLGVCFVNVLLAMITSSINLMKYLKCKEDSCYTMNFNVENEEGLLSTSFVGNRPSDVLIKQICNVFEAKGRTSTFGVAGDYLLSKAIIRENSYHVLSMTSRPICRDMIMFHKNADPNDYFRWYELITDLLSRPSLTNITCTTHQLPPFVYTYFPEINLLTLDIRAIELPKNPTIMYPFERDYKKYFTKNEFENLDEKLMAKGINPKVVMISFGVASIKPLVLKIHPTFYHRLIHILPYLPTAYAEMHMEASTLTYYTQAMSVPQLHDGRNIYPFLINGVMKEYYLKSMVIRLLPEYSISVGQIKQYYRTLPENKDNVETCIDLIVEEMRQILLGTVIEVNTDYYRYNIGFRIMLHKVCFYLIQEAPLQRGIEGLIHTVALIERNEKWMLMNDERSSLIDDIETFTKALKYETLTSVLLEERELSVQ
ncbi:hypothetical protein SNEBB_000558 [Seison nebaliae]|nr:hypothetical protein SNEBB_000558 [Seison nebaliae]